MLVGTFKNTLWSDSLVPFSIRKSHWNEFLKRKWWIEDPIKLFYTLLFCGVFLFVWWLGFFSTAQCNWKQSSSYEMLCRSSGRRGLTICLCFFLYPSKMISKENCFPCSQYVGTGGWKRRVRGKETQRLAENISLKGCFRFWLLLYSKLIKRSLEC